MTLPDPRLEPSLDPQPEPGLDPDLDRGRDRARDPGPGLGPVGFLGLGVMGRPMAENLLRAGTRLIVWNRSPGAAAALAQAGASVAGSVDEVFAAAPVVIAMMAGEALDATLGPGTTAFRRRVRDRLVVSMGTVSPEYSAMLAAATAAGGGRYVEAPVSGSRRPAEDGELVAMLAGADADLTAVRPLLAPMCARIVDCGPVPQALTLKLAVNIFLITLVAGLAEAYHFAAEHGLDRELVRTVLDAGQMASPISRVKIDKLVGGDFSAQAAMADVLYNNELIVAAARRAGVASPLIDVCRELYGEGVALGHGTEDMVAVLRAYEERTGRPRDRQWR